MQIVWSSWRCHVHISSVFTLLPQSPQCVLGHQNGSQFTRLCHKRNAMKTLYWQTHQFHLLWPTIHYWLSDSPLPQNYKHYYTCIKTAQSLRLAGQSEIRRVSSYSIMFKVLSTASLQLRSKSTGTYKTLNTLQILPGTLGRVLKSLVSPLR